MDIKIFPKPKEEKIEVGDIVEYTYMECHNPTLSLVVGNWESGNPSISLVSLNSLNECYIIANYNTIEGVRTDPDVYFVAKGSDCKLDIFKEE